MNKEFYNKFELSKEDLSRLKNHPSNLINDAKFVFNLDEITKGSEFENSLKSDKQFPKGNWIFKFNSFKILLTL